MLRNTNPCYWLLAINTQKNSFDLLLLNSFLSADSFSAALLVGLMVEDYWKEVGLFSNSLEGIEELKVCEY